MRHVFGLRSFGASNRSQSTRCPQETDRPKPWLSLYVHIIVIVPEPHTFVLNAESLDVVPNPGPASLAFSIFDPLLYS